MAERSCRFCGRPIMSAFLSDGAPVMIERQTTWDGDVFLTLVAGDLIANRCSRGQGDYRVHQCQANRPKLSFEQQQKSVARALSLAEKLAETRPAAGSRAATIVILAEEVRRLLSSPSTEREAVDALMAGYKVHIDDLPDPIIRLIEAIEACRKRYYM